MGMFDMFKRNTPTLTTADVAEAIVGLGAGVSNAKEDFMTAYNAMMKTFYRFQHEDKEIINMLYAELVIARCFFLFWFCNKNYYYPKTKNQVKLKYEFESQIKDLLDTIQGSYNIDLKKMYLFRESSYSDALSEDFGKEYLGATIKVAHEYFSNSSYRRLIMCKVSSNPNAPRPWMEGITSLDDVFYATTESMNVCYAIGEHMKRVADQCFSRVNIVE